MARPPRLARLLRRLDAPAEGRRRPRAASRFGYEAIPLDPPFATFARRRPADPASRTTSGVTYEQIARVSQQGRRRAGRLRRAARDARPRFLRPLMLRPPPALGSEAPGDLLDLLREAGRAAGLGAPRPRGPLPRDDDVGRRPARRLLRDRRDQGRVRVAPASSASGPARARPAPPTTCCTTTLGELDGVPGRVGRTCAAAWARSPRRSPPAPAPTAPTSAPTPSVATIDVDRRPRHRRHARPAARQLTRAARALRRAPASARCSTSSAPSTSPTRSPRTCAATAPAAAA